MLSEASGLSACLPGSGDFLSGASSGGFTPSYSGLVPGACSGDLLSTTVPGGDVPGACSGDLMPGSLSDYGRLRAKLLARDRLTLARSRRVSDGWSRCGVFIAQASQSAMAFSSVDDPIVADATERYCESSR